VGRPGALAPGTQFQDAYEILEELGSGGFGRVYKARQLSTGQLVAIKVLRFWESDSAADVANQVERFRRETRLCAELSHPNIVCLIDSGETGHGQLYAIFEYVPGSTLKDVLAREGGLGWTETVYLMTQVLDALACAHARGVVHRDLKPENIMVSADGRVKLVDFGIALDTTLRKMTWAGLSQTVGTPDYMAPEQVKGKRGDARSDLYALGVILYEMLTGDTPFHGDNVYAAMRAKLQDDPIPPRRLRPDISPALEEIILHALERDPRDRPESALELREALAHPDSVVLTGRASRQRPKPRMPRWVRTLLAIAAAGAGYGLLLWALSHAG